MDSTDADDILEMAKWLHDEYECQAACVGWDTQDGTSTDFENLPDDNKEVMVRLASALLDEFEVKNYDE